MSRLINTRRIAFLASTLLLLVAVQGCSVDSPTAPEQVPGPPPTSGGNNWKVSMSIEPEQLIAGSDAPATVKATFESRSVPGDYPPNGTTVVFTTSLGEFGAAGSSAASVAASLDRGKASVLLFAGDVVASGSVTASLEGSVGRKDFEVLSSDSFITSVTPSSGAASGGTVVTIQGVNFRSNARVFFGSKLGTVSSASSTRIVVTTPPGDMSTEECDDNGDGVNGIRTNDTPVNIKLEFADGGSEDLANGYTYLSPTGTSCVGD